MEFNNEDELKIFLISYAMSMEEFIVDYLYNEVEEPGLLMKHAMKAFLIYCASVALKDDYPNIDSIALDTLDELGSQIDGDINSIISERRSIKDEMLSAFKEYKRLEKYHGLNSVKKIENEFAKNVYRYDNINTSGILDSILTPLRNKF